MSILDKVIRFFLGPPPPQRLMPSDYDRRQKEFCAEQGIDPKLKECPKCGSLSAASYVTFYKGWEIRRFGACGHVDWDYPIRTTCAVEDLTDEEIANL